MMNRARLIFFALIQMTVIGAHGQDFTWEKNKPGQLFAPAKASAAGFRIKEVFDLFNKIPVIARPQGYDVHEWFVNTATGKMYSADLMINFYYFYRYQDGPVKQADAHTPTISIHVNKPEILMDKETKLFTEETNALHMADIFTDTFEITYKTINNCRVGEGINTRFGRPHKCWVLNPKGNRFFRPVTKAEYLAVFIENLRNKVAEDAKGLMESEKTLAEISKNEALKNSAEEFKKVHNSMVKFVAFEKSKLEHYKKKLASLNPEERRAPAFFAFYKGREALPYAPLEGTEDTLGTKPLFTFNETAFDPKMSKTAYQLIVINDAFGIDDDRELKNYLDQNFHPRVPYIQLTTLMDR